MHKPVPLFAYEHGKCKIVCGAAYIVIHDILEKKFWRRSAKFLQKRRHWVTLLFKSRDIYGGNDLLNDFLDGPLWLIESRCQYQSISIPTKCAQMRTFLWCTDSSQTVYVFARDSAAQYKFLFMVLCHIAHWRTVTNHMAQLVGT